MFYVQKRRCNQCLFTSKRIVTAERAQHYIKDCLKRDKYFVCHKKQTANFKHGDLCCRGFWDKFKHNVNVLRIAQRLGVVNFIEVSDGKEIGKRDNTAR